MSVISSWIWGTSQIDDAVDKATSELLPAGTEDIALNLEICDQIRSKSVPANYAMRALKRRLNHKNPNVQLLALALTDICVKNGGDHFLTEVASREFMDNLASILKIPVLNHDVKHAILRLIQNWSISFEGKPSLSYVGQVYKTLGNEGFKFPPRDPTAANSAMVDTQTAPEWIDSDVCLRCRTAFSFTNRKHHCRNCGLVFDQGCSSKSIPLPHFGITQEVRVCDGCYSKVTKKQEADKKARHSPTSPTSPHSGHSSRHRGRDADDPDLQRAIQLSLQESRGASGYRPGYVAAEPWQYSEPPIVDRSSHPPTRSAPIEDDDPDLRAAIEASLREANAPKPSAPIGLETPRSEEPQFAYGGYAYPQSYPPVTAPTIRVPNHDLNLSESDAILRFSQTIEQAQALGGRNMTGNPAVNEMYDQANNVSPKLAQSLDDAGRKEQMLTEMHAKMTQIVKLYDNLLTEQLSAPQWRSPPAATPNVPYQQATSSYHNGYNPVNGYSQWTQDPQQYAPHPAMSPPPQQYAPHPAISPPPQQYAPHLAMSPPPQQYAQEQAQGFAPPTNPTPQSPEAQWQYPQQTGHSAQPAPGAPQQWQQYQQPVGYAPTQTTGASTAPSVFSQTTASEAAQPPVHAAPSQYSAYTQSMMQSSTSPLTAPPQSPPVIAAQEAASAPSFAPSSTLSRHSTLSYTSAPQSNNTSLTRSNTVAHTPAPHQSSTQYAQQQQIQQQQQAQQQLQLQQAQQQYLHQQHIAQQLASAPAAPSVLAQQFPAAPTNAPQSYATYSSPQPERETLLIDL